MTNAVPLRWRTSSYTGSNGSCVAVAVAVDAVFIRNSNHPDAGTLTFSVSAMRAFVDTCKAGRLDHLGQ